MNCPFCNLSNEKNRILKMSKSIAVILSNPRLVDGHMLVIPVRHVQKISELTTDEKKKLWDTVEEFQEKILEKFAGGCDIRQNYRPFQEQSRLKVHHLHIHLLPRELNDELYQKCQIFEKQIFRDLKNEEAEKFVKLFAEHI